MVKIAIRDDEETLILDLKEQLDRYGRETGRELCLLEYHDGSELLAYYQPDLDLIFMDIRMEKVNGLKPRRRSAKWTARWESCFLPPCPGMSGRDTSTGQSIIC